MFTSIAFASRLYVNNPFAFGMSFLRYDLLRFKDFTTDGAVFARRQASFSTSCSFCFVNYFRMSRCCNSFNLENFVADLANLMLASIHFTSRLYVNNPFAFGVGFLHHNLLCFKDFSANRAMFARSQPRFSTSCSFCFINYFRMSICRNFRNFSNSRATRTMV